MLVLIIDFEILKMCYQDKFKLLYTTNLILILLITISCGGDCRRTRGLNLFTGVGYEIPRDVRSFARETWGNLKYFRLAFLSGFDFESYNKCNYIMFYSKWTSI